MNPLTAGICSILGNAPLSEVKAINVGFTVQLRSIKRITRTLERYWVIISDGKTFIQATLARKLHDLVTSRKITKSSVVTIDDFTCSLIRHRRVFIILDLHVISRKEKRIGNPILASSLAQLPAATARPGVASSTQVLHSDIDKARERSTCSIGCLSPFMQNQAIRARVIAKSAIQCYYHGPGGRTFTVTLLDESGEITATGCDGAVDKLYDKLEQGNVYYITPVRTIEIMRNSPRPGFRSKYGLRLEKDTTVEKCLEPTNIPMIRYNFTPIASLRELQPGSFCDVIAILRDIGPLREKTCTKWTAVRRPIQIRHINIMDKSQHVVRVTLWGKAAETFLADKLSIVVLKSAKVSDFGGRTLSMVSYGVMTISPDIEEAHLLRQWYDTIGAKATFHFYHGAWLL